MYSIVRITEKTYSEIKKLYISCFGKRVALSSIEAKYDTKDFGISNIGFFAIDNTGEFGAFYGVFPIILKYENRDLLVVQSGDTMTSPAHQKKGLFIKLAFETYQFAEAQGAELVFGFPNSNSYPGFKNKLGWVFVGNMQKFDLQSGSLPLCEFASRFSIVAPFYYALIRSKLASKRLPLEEINFDNFNFSSAKGLIKKDYLFFNYKLKQKKNYLLQKNGFQIFIKVDTHLIVGDVAKFNESRLPEFLSSLKQLAKELYCKRIIITVSKNHWLYGNLIAKISATDSLPIGFRLFNNSINPEEIQFIGADYDTF